ncbi:AMP-binding protein [Methanohalophilus sp.]|uniref:AMP-binding protein n=1 Tax=Methanohalophilus sp. TaxID=1966352 RepID=UPI00262AB64C|nr:AMP-binding protein [Methanohalophilus sp.]MDK2892263.1 acetyl-CoA synthetase [Methanohalophilus sp.]
MTSLISNFVPKTEFESYDDFYQNFKIHIPENFNFAYDVVDIYAKKQPNKKALVWCNDNGEEKIFTFADLKYYSEKAANLFSKYGIKKGDVVKLILKGRYEFWISILGLHRIGAIALPGSHMLTTRDLRYRIEKAKVKMIVSASDEGLLDYIDEAHEDFKDILKTKFVIDHDRPGWINFTEELAKSPDGFVRPEGDEMTQNEDISLMYFSSGTTGFPKMVQHDFTYPLAHIVTAGYWQNVMDNGLHLTVADSGWAKCAWGKIYGQWICGSAVFAYDYERFDAKNMLEKASHYKVNSFCAPPTVYRFLIKEDMSQYNFSNLNYSVVAGEPLNPEVYERFLEYTGLKLMEGYGQTETVVAIATYPWMKPKPGSMGKPSPIYKIELMRSDGKIADVGEEGEIVIDISKGKPLGLFTGYRGDPERTKKVWHDGYYHTGDLAWKDEDGYFWFVGRGDDIIKSSGYKIGPFEVESALMQHPAVLECAITGAPHPVRGQVVKATIVLTKEYKASEKLKKELQDHVKKITAPYKYPRIIEFVPELPKTISGKIRRVEIREHDSKGEEN